MHRHPIPRLGLALALSLLLPALAAAGDTVTYAGTIKNVDLGRGTFVVEDVGPRVSGQPAPIIPRTIVLTPSTEIFQARRTQDANSGFPGDYKTIAAARSALVEGAFASVECTPTGDACRALELTLVRADSAT